MLRPGDPIPLSKEQREALGKEVTEVVIALEAENHDLIADKPIHRDWYNATPDVPERTFPWRGAPLSDDTEVLTDSGWKLVQNVEVGIDRVMSRSPETGECAWMPVLARPEHYYDTLIHLKSKSVDQLVSPDHKVYVEKNDRSAWRFYRAGELPKSSQWKIPLTSTSWNGKHRDYLFGLPAGDVCEFVGWYIAEGWTYESGTIGIAQDENAHPERCRHLESLMDRLGFCWKRRGESQYLVRVRGYETGNGRYQNQKPGIYVPDELRELLANLGTAREKYIPRELKELSSPLLERLLWGMILGDGHIQQPRSNSFAKQPQIRYHTSSRQLADDVQEIAHKIGKRATLHYRPPRTGGTIQGRVIQGNESWSLSFCTRNYAKIERLTRKVVPYGRKAYCLTTPWHTIYIRRNGVPSITGNSNLVVPFIRTMTDPLIARAVLTTFSTSKLWVGTSENEFYRERLANWFSFLNYGARHGYDCFSPIHDFVTELYIHGEALMQQVWEENQREIVAPNAKKPTTVSLGRGPKMVFWPSEFALYDRENPVSEAEIIVLQNNMSWGKLTRAARLGGWDEDNVAAVEDQQGLEGSAAQVRNQKRKQLGLTATAPDIRLEPHDVREVWLDWPLFKSMSTKFNDIDSVCIGEHDPKAITVPIIVTLHRKTSRVLHAIYNPYLLPEWPFYSARYRNNDSRGLAKILEHIQRGMTTVVNQSIDAVTMANSVKFITRDQKLASRPFVPNQPLVTDDIEGIRELNQQKQIFPEINMVQLLQAMGERVGGQSDPNFGRETRMGGHPQPATNFLGSQANAQALNTIPMKGLRNVIAKVGEHRTILYQQFEKNRGNWIEQVFDEDDGQQILEVLNSEQVVSGHIRFDVHALSEMHNPDQERQRTILIDQMFTNYVAAVAKMIEVMSNPQAPPEERELMRQAIRAKGESLTSFLEASDVDNIEEYVFKLKEGTNGNLDALRLLAAQAGANPQVAAGGAEGPVREPGLASVPGGAGPGPGPVRRARGRDQLFG